MTPKRYIIVGDVHGMTLELKKLIQSVLLTRDDCLVFVGDLVDKGPDSVGTVQYARQLWMDGFNVVLVQGNHEEKHSRFRTAFTKAGEKGIKKFKGVDELRAITEQLTAEDIAFLDSAVPFFQIHEHNAVVVHGGILPEWEFLDAGDKGLVSRLLRTRHVTGKVQASVTLEFSGLEIDPDMDAGDGVHFIDVEGLLEEAMSIVVVKKQVRPKGSFISLGNEGVDDPYWAEVYDGRFGHAYFGHEPFVNAEFPAAFPHATGLDLGCVFGNRLAAVVLEGDQPRRVFTVEASGKFAEGLWDE